MSKHFGRGSGRLCNCKIPREPMVHEYPEFVPESASNSIASVLEQ